MKRFILFVMMGLGLGAGAQRTEVGAWCPDPVLRVANYPSASLKLSQLRPKLVILDFWNTHCISCVRAFPRLDSIQRKFGDRIQVMLVNRESAAETNAFFVRHRTIKKPRLPMIMGDTQLLKIFTREGYPYSVWIDGKGIVRYITSGYNTTDEHIEAVLREEPPVLIRAQKTKYISLLTDSPWKDDVVFFSALAPRRGRNETGNSILESEDGRAVHLKKTNAVLDLFKAAFSADEPRRFGWRGSIALEMKDSSLFVRPADANLLDAWMQRCWYNYELVVPATRRNEIYTIMQEELQRFFAVRARFEKRVVPAIVLVRTSRRDALHTAGSKPSGRLYPAYGEAPAADAVRVLVNRPFSELAFVLQTEIRNASGLPFVDETGYAASAIDIAIPWKAIERYDLEEWRRALRKYDLDLIEKPVAMDVLVIGDR